MVGNSANRGCVGAAQIWKDFGSPVARGSPGRAVDCADVSLFIRFLFLTPPLDEEEERDR